MPINCFKCEDNYSSDGETVAVRTRTIHTATTYVRPNMIANCYLGGGILTRWIIYGGERGGAKTCVHHKPNRNLIYGPIHLFRCHLLFCCLAQQQQERRNPTISSIVGRSSALFDITASGDTDWTCTPKWKVRLLHSTCTLR